MLDILPAARELLSLFDGTPASSRLSSCVFEDSRKCEKRSQIRVSKKMQKYRTTMKKKIDTTLEISAHIQRPENAFGSKQSALAIDPAGQRSESN